MEVELVSAEHYDIYFTTDGSDPENGELYMEPLVFTDGTTRLRAVCIDSEDRIGFELDETYVISYEPPEAPKIIPESGTYAEAESIVIWANAKNAAIYYAWDDDIPTVNSAMYTEPIEMPVGNHILSVIVINSHGLSSEIVRVNYDYEPQTAVEGQP